MWMRTTISESLSEMRECPFCGCKQIRLIHEMRRHNPTVGKWFVYVECLDNEHRGPNFWKDDGEIYGVSAIEAAKRDWNFRYNDFHLNSSVSMITTLTQISKSP